MASCPIPRSSPVETLTGSGAAVVVAGAVVGSAPASVVAVVDGVVGSAVTPPGHVSVYVDDPKVLQDAATKFKFPK